MLKLSNHAKKRAREYKVPIEAISSVEYEQFVPSEFTGSKIAVFLMRKKDRNARVFIIIDRKSNTVITVMEFLRTSIDGLNSELVIDEQRINQMKNQH